MIKMSERSENSNISKRLSFVNWPGLVAGVFMIALPFLGAWWRVLAGVGVFEIAISPFYYSIVLINQSITSSLVSYVLFAAKLLIWLAGGFLIIGSLFSSEWWGRKIVDWGAMKVFWMVISLILLFTVGVYLANRFLPSFISGMVGSGVEVQLSLPYLFGSGLAKIIRENVTITAPITISITKSFWIAIITAVLGVSTKIYHGRIEDKATKTESEAEEIESSENTTVEKGKDMGNENKSEKSEKET